MLNVGGRRALAIALVGIVLAAGCSSSGSSDSSADEKAPTTAAPAKKRPDPGTQSVGDASGAGYTPTGELVADNGFRPENDGFGFENYGTADPPDVANLGPEEMRKLFGDKVCSNLASGTCDLTPPAEQWMDQANKATEGGHCQGFSVLSGLLWKQVERPSAFGAPKTPDLAIDGNEPLQREIAYAFTFQSLDAYNAAIIKGTPSDILDKLVEVLKPGNKDTYTIGIYKRGFEGGHAVTPYAVEDAGGGIFKVLIYDNNYPKTTRAITIDRNKDTWRYDAATNPSEPSELYEGDAESATLDLEPTSPGVGVQPCPFCQDLKQSEADAAKGAKGAAGPALDEIWLDGSDVDHAHLVITDPQGHRLGIVKGAFVNEIPGAHAVFSKASKDWSELIEPDYYVPDGVDYKIAIDGTALEEADDTSVGVIGPSFDVTVDDLTIQPGETASLSLAKDITNVTFASTGTQKPSIEVGWSDDVDYDFTLSGMTLKGGSALSMGFPSDAGDLVLSNTPGTNLDLTFDRTDDQANATFKHDHLALGRGDKAVLHYDQFEAHGDPVPLDLTHAGRTATQQLADQGS